MFLLQLLVDSGCLGLSVNLSQFVFERTRASCFFVDHKNISGNICCLRVANRGLLSTVQRMLSAIMLQKSVIFVASRKTTIFRLERS
jgi:hypothetical protein